MSPHSEIFEQPERLGKLLTSQRKAVEEIAAAIKRRKIQCVFLAARGNVQQCANVCQLPAGRDESTAPGPGNLFPIHLLRATAGSGWRSGVRRQLVPLLTSRISPNTAKKHLTHISEKLAVKNHAKTAARAES